MGFHLLGVCESELTLVYWTGAFFRFNPHKNKSW